MRRLVKFALCATVISTAIACSDASNTQARDEADLRVATGAWVEAYNQNDWTALSKQFSKDGVMMPPNSPAVIGRDAIAAWETANETGFRIALKADDIALLGDVAIIRGRSCVFIPLNAEETGVDIGKYVEIRERSATGEWLISQDIFNSDLPAESLLRDDCPSDISGM